MATSTPYLNLVKPAYSETADIGVLNENADKIDQAANAQAQAIAGKPDDATEMPLGPNDTTLVSQAITNLQNEIGIVCTGNTCAISAASGQYVVLKNSTISGRADGLYTAAKTIPANTVIDSTYLTAVSSGGLNDLQSQVSSLNSKLKQETLTITRTENAFVDSTSVDRIIAQKKNGILFCAFNCNVTAGNTSDFVEIGKISGWSALSNILVTVPPQNGSNQVMLLQISPTGVISIYGANGLTTSFYRTYLSAPSTS